MSTATPKCWSWAPVRWAWSPVPNSPAAASDLNDTTTIADYFANARS